MPQASSVASDDLASTDEVKVYKDEGEGEDEKRSSENLNEEKMGLLTETEEGKSSDIEGQNCFSPDEKLHHLFNPGMKMPEFLLRDHLPFGYPLLPPYPYPSSPPLSSTNKIFPPPPPGLGFFMYGNESVSSPPPAHMGIPPLHIDLKTGLPRPPLYGLPPPSPSHLYSGGEFSHLTGPSGPLHSPYSPPTLTSSPLSWFHPSGIFPHNFGLGHPTSISSNGIHDLSPLSESLENSRHRLNGCNKSLSVDKKRNYIKKPLNAFMLFMKEMRQKVIEECTLKESAAINQILGRKWHALERSEQAKYYEMAKKEKELHMQLHPGWSARDNYATHTKKKKLKRENQDSLLDSDSQSSKKLRVNFTNSGDACQTPRLPPGDSMNRHGISSLKNQVVL